MFLIDLYTKFEGNRIKIGTFRVFTHTHTQKNMTSMALGVFVEKWQSKVGLRGYDILFTYFVVKVKSKIPYVIRDWPNVVIYLIYESGNSEI